MRLVPWWALLSAGLAPVLLVAGWTTAERLQGPGYNPSTKTISVLAAYGAPGYWVMTGMMIALGVCYMVTAQGLRGAALAGRAALAAGGVAAMVLTLAPAPPSGGSFGHGAVVTVGFVLLAGWPVLAADRSGIAPWALQPTVAIAVTALMAAGAVWFLVEVAIQGIAGIAERALTFAQALWPLLVVVSCARHPARSESAPWFSRG
ncbi:DUF998 domain-containing protein [Streptomyces sp. NPDC088725]|uniref:DUF998 domain-containing protein n=1 Tax=Streptomyces sp. NPDC088725 TaxID=3365873 RepID=UPI0037F770F2